LSGDDLVSIIGVSIRDQVIRSQLSSWIAGIRDVPKRYFIVNAFDEAVAFLGLILGAYFGGFLSAKILLTSIVNAGIAMCVSGFTAAILIEEAELARILEPLRPKLVYLRGDVLRRIERLGRSHIFKSGLASGLAALISSLLVSLPYLISVEGLISVNDAFSFSIIIVVILLFILGMVLGKTAGNRELRYCLATVMAGLVTGFLCMLLGFIE